MVKSPPPGVNNDITDDTPFEALSEKSLKAAGYAYLVGDAGLFASGMMAGRYKEAASGLWWGAGGLICAKYGNPNAEKQFKLLSHRLGDYLQKQHVVIPHTPDTKYLTQHQGVIDQIESFLYAYPSQILNAGYGIGAVSLIRSGLQNNKQWDTASGALVAAGALAGLLIPEKQPDPEHPPKTAFNKAISWIQEKPLRLSGAFYWANNATLLKSALDERKANPAQKSYLFKFFTAASYIFGNAMLAMSSKDNHAGGSNQNIAMEKLASSAAQVIAAQHPELQDALVNHIAGYLAAQPEVHMKADEISALLTGKLHQTARSVPAENWMQALLNTPASSLSVSR